MSKLLKNCPACGAEVAKGVKKCPSCGKDVRNFFMKHKIISVIGILFILSAIGNASGGSSTATKTTPASTPAVADTTPAVTTPATTPAVTTPAVTTPASTTSTENIAYKSMMTTYAGNMGGHFGTLSDLTTNADLNSSAWIQEMAVCISNIKRDIADIRALDAPPKFKSVQGYMLQACDDYETSLNYLVKGVDQNSPTYVDKASTYMKKGGAHTNQALDEMGKLGL